MITASIALCPRGEEQERAVNQAMEAVEKIEGVVNGKKLFGGESIGYLDICLVSKMEAPIVKDGGSNYQRWRLQIWRLQIVNNLTTNPPFFLLC